MAKLTLSDVTNLENQTSATNTINANMALIEAALETTLSRNGIVPNTMESPLDMNSNRIVNLPAALNATEPVRLAEFQGAVAGALGLTVSGVVVALTPSDITTRDITGTADEITVTNGSGVSGNPTVSLPSALTFTGKTITGGTYAAPALTTPALGVATGTSLALGGATLGSDALAWTGSATGSGVLTAGSFVPTSAAVPTNGMYSSAANIINFSTNSSNRFGISAGGSFFADSASGALIPSGAASATVPSFAPNRTDTTTGIGAQAAGNISLITAGVERVRVTDTGLNNAAIGATTASTGSFTTLTTSGALTYGGVTLSNSVTGTGPMVLSTNAALTTPNLGIPSAVTLTNGTGLPIATGVSGLGTGIATFLATPSSANLRAALTDETGTGIAYFVGGALGTPASATLTNATGLPTAGLVDDAVTYAKMQNVSATSRILGRKTTGAGDPEELTLSETLDFIGSAAQGDLLYRGAAGWARLGAGTSGHFLKTLGTGANPAWDSIPGGGDMLAANNLSDVANVRTARQNIGVYKKGTDVASAGTTSLTGTTSDLVDVTGTTTITAITLSEGDEKVVRFTGALTLTNGASLILPGAANITTAAGDFAVFRGYAAGVVRVVSYARAADKPTISGSFTATLTGCTTSPTMTMNYSKVGRIVTISGSGLGGISGTSNSTNKTLTGMPAALYPPADTFFLGSASDNGGAYTPSLSYVTTAGALVLLKDIAGSGWTASGTAGYYFMSISYVAAS